MSIVYIILTVKYSVNAKYNSLNKAIYNMALRILLTQFLLLSFSNAAGNKI